MRGRPRRWQIRATDPIKGKKEHGKLNKKGKGKTGKLGIPMSHGYTHPWPHLSHHQPVGLRVSVPCDVSQRVGRSKLQLGSPTPLLECIAIWVFPPLEGRILSGGDSIGFHDSIGFL